MGVTNFSIYRGATNGWRAGAPVLFRGGAWTRCYATRFRSGIWEPVGGSFGVAGTSDNIVTVRPTNVPPLDGVIDSIQSTGPSRVDLVFRGPADSRYKLQVEDSIYIIQGWGISVSPPPGHSLLSGNDLEANLLYNHLQRLIGRPHIYMALIT